MTKVRYTYIVLNSFPSYIYDSSLGKFVENPDFSWCQLAVRAYSIVQSHDEILGWVELGLNWKKAFLKEFSHEVDLDGIRKTHICNVDGTKTNYWIQTVPNSTEKDYKLRLDEIRREKLKPKLISYAIDERRIGKLKYQEIQNKNPSYNTLLLTREWHLFKHTVHYAHDWTCQQCKRRGTITEQLDFNKSGLPFYWDYSIMKSDAMLKEVKQAYFDFLKSSNINTVSMLDYCVNWMANFNTPKPIIANEHVELHAHHEFYIQGRLPWEYPLEAMTTLCSECHSKVDHDKVRAI